MNTKRNSSEIDPSLKSISRYLVQHHETIAVAESVTAGHVQTLLSSAEQATQCFQGGITAYNLNQKVKHLNVDPLKGLTNNCVSEEVAAQMAKGVCQQFASHWGLGITGYAATIPDQGINTLFAFYAFAYKEEVVFTNLLISSPTADIKKVQSYYATHLLYSFSRFLQEHAALSRKPLLEFH
jgi:PncC family amidohydrolase